MWICFTKYHGGGNDFILIDSRSIGEEWLDAAVVKRVCCRYTGIGADGVILVGNSERADYRMRIFNADGSEPAMCGNGIRAAVHFINHSSPELTIETLSGLLRCQKNGGEISVDLGAPSVLQWPASCLGHELFVVDTGVPHAVVFVEDLDGVSVAELGRDLRTHPQFAPHGVNVNFTKVSPDGTVCIRTYERGVEGETRSCGTGSAAAAFAVAELLGMPSPIKVQSRGGAELHFHFSSQEDGARAVKMVAGATPVFEGKFPLAQLD